MCAVVTIGNQSVPVNHPSQKYTCEGSGSLDDPYEGELFTWFLYFFGGLPSFDRNQLWEVKRPQLAAIDYQSQTYQNITVQKGFVRR